VGVTRGLMWVLHVDSCLDPHQKQEIFPFPKESRSLTSVDQWLACLPLDPRFAGSIPTEVDGFLRVIKIRITTSFGGEVKPSVPCRRFTACKRTLRHE
jgi:hypothetical protein